MKRILFASLFVAFSGAVAPRAGADDLTDLDAAIVTVKPNFEVQATISGEDGAKPKTVTGIKKGVFRVITDASSGSSPSVGPFVATTTWSPKGRPVAISGFRLGDSNRIVTRLDPAELKSQKTPLSAGGLDWETDDALLVAFDVTTGLAILKIQQSGSDETPILELAGANPKRGQTATLLRRYFDGVNVAEPLTFISSPWPMPETGELSLVLDKPFPASAMGAPLIDDAGRVVAVLAFPDSDLSGSSHAIAICQSVLAKLIEFVDDGGTGEMPRAMLGVSIEPKTDQIKVIAKVDTADADKIALKAGDVIKAIGDVKIKSFADLRTALASVKPEMTVTVTVNRDGDDKKVKTVTIARSAKAKNEATAKIVVGSRVTGLELTKSLPPEAQEKVFEQLEKLGIDPKVLESKPEIDSAQQWERKVAEIVALALMNAKGLAENSKMAKETREKTIRRVDKVLKGYPLRTNQVVIGVPPDVNQRLDELNKKLDALTKVIEEKLGN